eukprot:CAMPEP_0181195500 /NCGR_PEP_ID=MMETSP1096-20121128/14925_1 /TAXON_ID=156174 ORGANISM="Chrysochromulina ericina, Strain CCMP281" /NCGR_SAMPLE_ID=MMETSP1096 /ASSEMBLY_ACC=CAM_ASM_000453 /LENGTH=129 /DNA_ID=CAMNT_0023285117 /DNA_START=608 /DNA_END=997 /DNA_ORIENTATION=+
MSACDCNSFAIALSCSLARFSTELPLSFTTGIKTWSQRGLTCSVENSAPRNTRPHEQRKLHHLRLISLSCTAFAKFPICSRGDSMRRNDGLECCDLDGCRNLLGELARAPTLVRYVPELVSRVVGRGCV